MANEPVADTDIAAQIADIEADLTRLMQFLRQLSDDQYAIEPKGCALVEGMIFETSSKVSALRSAAVARLREYREVISSADQAIRDVDADDREMAAMLVLMRRGAAQIEQRLRARIIDPAVPDAMPTPPLPVNVVAFTGNYRPEPANDSHGSIA